MKNKFLYFLGFLNFLTITILCVLVFTKENNQKDFSDKILKVKGLVVVDSLGVERVIIGAPLPYPTSYGKRHLRGGEGGISGILLFDSEGQERSGYATDDYYGNVFFTLDSKVQQNALFIAEPQGSTSLMLWARNGNKITIGANNDTTKVTITSKGKKTKFSTNE